MRLYSVALICVWSLSSSAQDQLEKARATYLNQSVVVTGSVFHLATEDSGRYRGADSAPFIAESYKGQVATVIAVQAKEAPATPVKLNVMGEPIQAPASNEMEFVIRFTDGVIGIRSDSLSTIKAWLMLPAEVQAKEAKNKESEEKATKLVGSQVFATALSQLFTPDATELSDHTRKWTIPHLVPLKIAAAKWDRERQCAIVKLETPEGDQAFALMSLEPSGILQDDIGCSGGQLWNAIPGYLDRAEIAAIRSSTPSRGMSVVALYYAIGYPDHETDWGRGGRQLVYKGGLYVYTDQNNKVIDWQRMSR